jgi:hypothetical protein
MYLRYCYELGILPRYRQDRARLHILLKEDLLKCDQYSEQAKLLSKYHVDTEKDLSELMDELRTKMTELGSERSELRLKARHALPEEEKEKARADARELTTVIRELRHELKVCEDIRERSGHVRDNLETIDRDRQREWQRTYV